MTNKEKQQHTIRGICIIAITLMIMLGIGLTCNLITGNFEKKQEARTFNAQLNNKILIEKIEASEVHYIDSSLLNVPLSVPYEITPTNATNKDIYMISSDNSIVVVNDDNTITALQKGTVKLTLVANDGSSVSTEIEIIIK